MKIRLYHIIPELQPYISMICTMDCSAMLEPHAFRVLPDACAELFVNYSSLPLAGISGTSTAESSRSFTTFRMSSYMDVSMHPGTACVAVWFRPGKAYRFFPAPMNELSDKVAGLSILWKEAAWLEEKVAGATNDEDRVRIVQDILLQKLLKLKRDDSHVAFCLWQVNNAQGLLSVRELSEKANISSRQLGRRFNDSVGLSPKEFTRISRFIHSLKQLKKFPSQSLTSLAYNSGYYDQSHFIRDFKDYAGVTPGELLNSGNRILY
jgi:AraC-like DNA-binding protein